MKPAISTSKITPPRLRQVMDRPHLFERLEQNKTKKLTLILGQAAQGKSTLAASYIRQSDIPTAWVNLQRQDSSPVNLFFSMVYALHHVFQGTQLLPLLNYPSVSMGLRLEMPLYREWVNAIFDSVAGPVQIVLDGLNNLAPTAPSFGFLDIMLEELPQDYHMLMLSRHIPPLNIEGLKIKREAHVLTNSDLAFTRKEIKAFFREIWGMTFTSEQIKRIHTFTQGWIGGLILLSEILDRLPEEARGEYVSEDIPDQFKGEVFQYFTEEIVASQPAAVQEFLIKSCIFDTIDPSFMKEMVELEDAETILKDSAKKNLFIEARYVAKKGWEFRYHPLFRDFLKVKFKSVIDEDQRRRLFLRAGMLHEHRGELEQSVAYYLKARAFDRATSVVEQIGMHLLNIGRDTDVSQWLREFPGKLVWENPWLLLYQSMTRRFTQLEENLDTLRRCLNLFENDHQIRGQLLSLAALIETIMLRGRDIMPLRVLFEKGEQLLNAKASASYPYEKAMLLFQTGFGLTVRSTDQRKAYWICRDAYMLARTQQDLVLQINTVMYASQAITFIGEFSAAEEELAKVRPLIQRCPYPELQAMYFISQLPLWLFQGSVDKAAQLLKQARAEVQQHGLVYLHPYTLMYEVMLYVALERFAEAEQAAERLLEIATSTDNLFLQGATTLLLGINFYRKEAYEEAWRFLARSSQILSSDEAYSPYHLLNLKIVTGLTSLHIGKMSGQKMELQVVLDDYTHLTNQKVHALFAMALLYAKQGNNPQAALLLDEAFMIVEDQGYEYFWLMNTADLLAVCVLALEVASPKAAACASHLLSTSLASVAGVELERLSTHPHARMRKGPKKSNVPSIEVNCHAYISRPWAVLGYIGILHPFTRKHGRALNPKPF